MTLDSRPLFLHSKPATQLTSHRTACQLLNGSPWLGGGRKSSDQKSVSSGLSCGPAHWAGLPHLAMSFTVQLWLMYTFKGNKITALFNVEGGRNLLSLAGMLLAHTGKKLYSSRMRYLAHSEFSVFLYLRLSYESQSQLWLRENSEVFYPLGIQHSGLLLAF